MLSQRYLSSGEEEGHEIEKQNNDRECGRDCGDGCWAEGQECVQFGNEGKQDFWGQGLLSQSSEWQEELARQNSEDGSCR